MTLLIFFFVAATFSLTIFLSQNYPIMDHEQVPKEERQQEEDEENKKKLQISCGMR
jgi:hypothetical protein